MSIGRKIKIIKKNILLFVKNFFPEYLYNLLIYRISKKKFSKVLNSPKIYIKKSSNLDKINNYEFLLFYSLKEIRYKLGIHKIHYSPGYFF